ncbi:MAG TPA: PLP-dependent aspartate aminotransferase family protein [Chloroflexota bacterium]|jgi:cystathionine gamma-lyase|nr:PLP-dependent aspartate aminotransferase family protein [Chloroflexota bacterium]
MSTADGAWQFATQAIHSGQQPDAGTGAVVTPIYQTSTFAVEDMDADQPYFYSRRANPTRTALERCLAELDGGTHAFAFASGIAAVAAVAHLVQAGAHALIITDVYGGTRNLYNNLLKDQNIHAEFVDFTDLAAVEHALAQRPRLVWLESPTNPLLNVIDVPAVTRMAHQVDALVAMDNTLASPYLQRPLDFGVDLVVYSTTKYHGGHSDLLGGAVIARDEALAERVGEIQYTMGAVPGPLDAWLVLRGIKTLALRMERHSANALQLAHALAEHPAVACVRYPGLKSHPQHQLAARQMRLFGGMLSLDLRGGRAAARTLCESVRLFTYAPSLGGVESLIGHPATMTHRHCTPEERRAIGIGDGLVRLSVGIEHADDLQRDLLDALDSLSR